MSLQKTINNDLISSMKNKDAMTTNVLRQLKTTLKNQSLGKGNIDAELSDMEILTTIRKRIAQGEDSIQNFTTGERMDLVDIEKAEINILKKYLPQELTESELDQMIANAIQLTNATSKKDMGKVIKLVVEQAQGRIDNKTISQKVGILLT